MITGFNLSNT